MEGVTLPPPIKIARLRLCLKRLIIKEIIETAVSYSFI